MMKSILHIPHSSGMIPVAFRESFLLPEEELFAEKLRMTDSHTLELFGGGDSVEVVAPVSRLLVDVERFEDDHSEPMAARGMGVIYTRTHDMRPLRRPPSAREREMLLETYYRPHHARLRQRVAESLSRNGRALIIDCHSFPSRQLPYETCAPGVRPEICIGTDPFHTPSALAESVVGAFENEGCTVAVDYPFAGSITPADYYGKDARVVSLMIEVRRDLYMDEDTGITHCGFSSIRSMLGRIIPMLEESF